MEIVDAQVHLNYVGSMDSGLAAMDAAGIGASVIDEWYGLSPTGKFLPGEELPNGAVRTLRSPIAEAYVSRCPDRFSYYGRVDPFDPDLEAVMAQILAQPGCRCLRVS